VLFTRWVVRLTLALVVLVAIVVVAGDFWVRSEAQKVLANRVRSSTGSLSVSVHIAAFPFLYDLAFSKIPDVKVVADGVPVGALRLSQVRVDAHQVEMDHHFLLSGNKIRVASISKATVTILIQEAALESLAKAVNAEVSLVAGHELVVMALGHQVLSVGLTSNRLIPDCAFALQKVPEGFSLACTISPAPPSLLTTLSSKTG
jgi:DUF2993 family protein